MSIAVNDIFHELKFSTARSGGPGGQNVNKVNSKVILKWDIAQSVILSEESKQLLLLKLKSHCTHDGELMLQSQESRSQLDNKENVVRKLERLLKKAFEVQKPRKKTKPGKAAVEKRMKEKKKHSDKKKWRQSRLD